MKWISLRRSSEKGNSKIKSKVVGGDNAVVGSNAELHKPQLEPHPSERSSATLSHREGLAPARRAGSGHNHVGQTTPVNAGQTSSVNAGGIATFSQWRRLQ
jgi:hypothetical protein